MPWPVDSDGTRPEDLPYGHSVFPTVLDDLRGYEPRAVGLDIDPSGREVILVAVSPGAYIETTMIGRGKVPGQDPEGSGKLAETALMEARGRRSPEATQPTPAPPPDTPHRETI